MTSNPNYIAPQSASAPITTNLRKDELAALLTVDQGATAQQRIVATGNSIPLVFCKQVEAVGGAWITPPAARYGIEENPNLGDYFAFGLIISDGRMPAILEADVWKGPIRVNALTGYGITNAYGSMPTDGYNYTLSSVGSDTAATSTTTTQSFNYSQPNAGFSFSGNSYTISVSGCTRLSFGGSRVSNSATGPVTYFHGYTVTANGSVVDTSFPFQSSSWGGDYSFPTPSSVQLTISTTFSNYFPNPAYLRFTTLSYAYQTTTTVTTPFIPGAVTNLPLFAGSGGSFAGMSTLAVKGRYSTDAETGTYKQQIRCFVRNGVEVDHVLGGSGSSSSFPDLALYLLKNASKVSAQLIDLASLQSAELFNTKYQLYFNGVLANSVNLRDYLTRVAPFFLLRFVQIDGRFALKPVLPLDSESNILTTEVTPVAVFDDRNIVAGSFQKDYIDIRQRKPFCALMSWRTQAESVYGTPKTSEVRYAGTAVDGPFEQYDMEEFCTTENHATLVGRYILASRKLTTHTVSFQTTELVGSLVPTDVIQVTWDYATSMSANETSAIMYQVDAVSEGSNGVFRIDATHFPTTANNASQVAIDMLTGL